MEFHRKAGEISALTTHNPRILVAGVGAAGANILRRIVMDGGDPDSLVCMDTDLGTLNGCAAAKRVQLGRNLTRGLTAGGDPDLGREAAQESEQEIRQAFRGADLVFLCTGLGGGTASGAAPVIARLAREEQCFVLVFVTMPFHFEGRRRQTQAREALAQIKPYAGALLTFENDRMGQLIVPTEGVQKAFAIADTTICHSIRAITTMLEKPGMIRVGLEQLLSVLNGQDARCLFGFGKATGNDRAVIAVRAALENPLLHDGDLLSSASTVLVHMSGNRSVTLAEVEQVMSEISSRLNPATEVLFGVSASDDIGNELWVAIISSVSRSQGAAPVAPAPQLVLPAQPLPLAAPEPGVSAPVAPAPVASSVVAPAASVHEEPPSLVPPGPLKPRIKAPLPMPPAPAPIPARPVPKLQRLISPKHLDAPPATAGIHASEPLPVARPVPPPVPGPSPTPGVQIDYTPNGAGGNGTGTSATITLDPPQPSFLNRENGQKPPSPPTVTPPPAAIPAASPAGQESPIRKVLGMPSNGQGNGAGAPPQDSAPSSLLAMRHRGRFEYCEPTIIDGQDMDLPTFIRKQRRQD